MAINIGRREFVKGVGFGLAGLAVGPVGALLGKAEEAVKPNFLFIIGDDCTFRDIGCYGGQAHTPNIDRLAKEGMRFTQSFQAAPMCSPTRHNIYTGLYPVKSGGVSESCLRKGGDQEHRSLFRAVGISGGA